MKIDNFDLDQEILVVAEIGNTKLKRIGINDCFCGIGSACHLMVAEGLTSINIANKVIDLIKS